MLGKAESILLSGCRLRTEPAVGRVPPAFSVNESKNAGNFPGRRGDATPGGHLLCCEIDPHRSGFPRSSNQSDLFCSFPWSSNQSAAYYSFNGIEIRLPRITSPRELKPVHRVLPLALFLSSCFRKFEKVDKSLLEKWHIPNSLGIRL